MVTLLRLFDTLGVLGVGVSLCVIYVKLRNGAAKSEVAKYTSLIWQHPFSVFPLVWVQDYGREKSSGIGVDGQDVLLIEDAYGVSSPHPHSPRYATPCSSALSKK